MKKIAYYITAHGYGHGTRSCDIINGLHERSPETPIIVKTDLPVDFMRGRLPAEVVIISDAFDVGLIQKDSIRVDLEASLQAVEDLYKNETVLIEQEELFIQKNNIGVVVADLPAIPLAAAERAGIPAIAVGNFGWDWIYADLLKYNPRWQRYIDKIQQVYKKTDLLIRIPFAEPMSTFTNPIDVPLLAKPGKEKRKQVAALTQADLSKTWVLLSFTSLDLDQAALKNIAALDHYEFFSVEPLVWAESTIHSIDRAHVCFADMLASVDLVITKPGFGIVSECIANHKSIIYADRENFPEYAILVKNIELYCHNAFIPASELYSGRLENALSMLKNAPLPQKKMASGGAALAAAEIIKRIKE